MKRDNVFFLLVAIIFSVLSVVVVQADAASYTITADVGYHGSIAPRGMISVNAGDSQTFTITPDFGYAVSDVLVDNSPISTIPESGGTYTFSNVTSTHSIWASFKPISFTISGRVRNFSGTGIPWVSISFSNNGGMVATDSNGDYTQSVPYNYSGTVTPSLTGYSFSPASRVYTNVLADQKFQDYQEAAQAGLSVTPSSRSVGSAAGTTIFSVSNTGTGTMAWSAQTADSWLSITSGSSGTNSGTITCSFQANTTAASRTGFIKVWETGGSRTSVEVVQSAPAPLTITASAGTGGSITPSGSVSVNYGSDQSFTITPSTGYEVASVTVDSAAITTIPSSGGIYTFSKVTANHAISAAFKSKTLTISGSVKTTSGTAVSGVAISFSNNGGAATTDTSGNYAITVPYNYSGIATPSKTGFTFTPVSRTYSNVVANQISQDYQASQPVLTVTPSTRNVGSAAGTTTFSVSNTGSGTMAWTAVSGSSWLTITSGTSGTNSGTIICSFIVNTDVSERTGTIKITAAGALGSPIDVKVTQTARAVSTIPDTGLTKCYSAIDVITCPSTGQPFYGQDANYIMNSMSYTKIDNSGNALPDHAASWAMVKDNVTGLFWEMKTNKDGVKNYNDPHDADNGYTWYDSNPATNGGYAGTPGNGTDTEDFVKLLNSTRYGGYSDWRLPSIKELQALVDYESGSGSDRPMINTSYFPNTQQYYWSSTTYAYSNLGAWVMEMGYAWPPGIIHGNNLGYNKAGYYCVRAVRGGQSEQFGNSEIRLLNSFDSDVIDDETTVGGYIDNGDGTVTDIGTGLMWQQDGSAIRAWEQALAVCESLNLGGYTDWRLPNIKELLSLVDFSRHSPAINKTYFPNTIGGFTNMLDYWSATPTASDPDTSYYARTVRFSGTGDSVNGNKIASNYVRAVRGGQIGGIGDLVVSPLSRNVNKNTGTTIFSVSNAGTGNMSWTATVKSGSDWLSIISGSSGNNSGTITCKFNANINISARTGTIQVNASGATGSPKEVSVIQASVLQPSVKFLGAWSDGIWSWDKNTNKWAMIPSTANASMIAAGKIDSDTVDDLIAVWASGLYVRKSTNGQWLRLTTTLPTWIAAGDLNNDGLDDVIGSWVEAVYFWDPATGVWPKITSAAKQIASGNVGGSRDDLVGVWSDNCLWVRYSADGSWQKIDTVLPVWITTGDMTGDNRADIIGSYSTGTWYRNSANGTWTKITTPAEQLASGDMDGDGRDDLIGIWSDGVYVRYSATGEWQRITTSKPKWIATGRIVEPNQASGASNDLVDQLNAIDMSASSPGNNVN
jgi:hypothetical protein